MYRLLDNLTYRLQFLNKKNPIKQPRTTKAETTGTTTVIKTLSWLFLSLQHSVFVEAIQ